MKRRKWNARGQSALEYMLILAVVIAAVAAAAAIFQPAVNNTLNQSGVAITNAGNQLGAKLQ
jgi:Flp pilus assembly pilin Flp